jgi:hypothetical protein
MSEGYQEAGRDFNSPWMFTQGKFYIGSKWIF